MGDGVYMKNVEFKPAKVKRLTMDSGRARMELILSKRVPAPWRGALQRYMNDNADHVSEYWVNASGNRVYGVSVIEHTRLFLGSVDQLDIQDVPQNHPQALGVLRFILAAIRYANDPANWKGHLPPIDQRALRELATGE